jgi:hypothetical protein
MAETNCVIVRTTGRQLDELRSQASLSIPTAWAALSDVTGR